MFTKGSVDGLWVDVIDGNSVDWYMNIMLHTFHMMGLFLLHNIRNNVLYVCMLHDSEQVSTEQL
jgi:hypothetical protein